MKLATRRDAVPNSRTTIVTKPPREAARLNEALEKLGYSDDALSLWWNDGAHSELGWRSAAQAWEAGDHDAVVALVEVTAGDNKRWIEHTNQLIANGEIQDLIARQKTPQEIVDDWRAGHPT
jgi:hypothetical protein